MMKKEKRMVEQEFAVDFLCNMCGKSLMVPIAGDDGPKDTCGLVRCRVAGSYASPVLLDGTVCEFDLCEECLDKMFNQFKIPVLKEHW